MTYICPVHGNPLPADAVVWDDTMCGDRRCWERFGLRQPPRPDAVVKPPTAPKSRRGLCEYLGERVEFRPGCNGRLCKHVCEAGEPEAVPGGVCQTCPKWVPRYSLG